MNLDQLVASALGFSAGFGIKTATILFIVCAVGELAVPIPLLLETMWLLAGYYLGAGNLSAGQLIGLWMIAQLGRQTGSISLYYVAGRGADRLILLDRKLRLSRFVPRSIVKSKAAKHIADVSPFSAAFARLVGLRLPLVIVAAAKKRWKSLSVGVLLSSVVWDGIYISLGVISGTTKALSPLQMLGVTVGGLALVYLVMLLVRTAVKRLKSRHRPTASAANEGDRSR